MENSFFVFSNKGTPIELERFHICTWEFKNSSSLVEFGFEISKTSINTDHLNLSLFIPWFSKGCEINDLYENLSNPENSRFIFNDSIISTDSLDGGRNKLGVIYKFSNRDELCILPVSTSRPEDNIITAHLNLQPYRNFDPDSEANVYFRFLVRPEFPFVSMRKKGISKSTIIYDIKINEQRNIPDEKVNFFSDKEFCKIKSCFSFNILPNKYDIVFFENASLMNVRTLEYDSFNKYLDDKRVKKDELIVVFNKKKNAESFSFFSIYSKERIGPGQFALAILINIICGILLFIPAYRKTFIPPKDLFQIWFHLPFEIYLAITIVFGTIVYFMWPLIINGFKKVFN